MEYLHNYIFKVGVLFSGNTMRVWETNLLRF